MSQQRMMNFNIFCIQWPTFGPYHRARLHATTSRLHSAGIDVIGLQTMAQSATNTWEQLEQEDICVKTVFPRAALHVLTPRVVRHRIWDILDNLNPDAVAITAYSMADAQACLTWCMRNRRIAILMAESTEADADRRAWREYVKGILVYQYDAAFAGGTKQREYLITLGYPAERIVLGYDVVDNDYFRQCAASFRKSVARPQLPGIQDNEPYFLASNRFMARKNLRRLLTAYQLYRTQSPDPWRLILLGDGELRPQLERFVSENAIPGVTFAGFRQMDELPAYYAFAGAFIHAAEREMWGLVVNEAMASGLPVIVSETTGCVPDLVLHGGNGFTFDPFNEVDLAGLMHRIATDASLRERMGRKSLEIIANWDLDRFAEGMQRALEIGMSAPKPRTTSRIAARTILFTLSRLSRRYDSFTEVDY